MAQPARRIQQQFSLAATLYRLLDAACVVGGLFAAVRWTKTDHLDLLAPAALASLVHYFAAETFGLYRARRGADGQRRVISRVMTWLVALLIVTAIGFLIDRLNTYPRIVLGAWFLTTSLAIIVAHGAISLVQRLFWQRGLNTRSAAIVGMTELGFQLGRNLLAAPELGLKLAGYYDDRPADRNPELPAGLKRQIGGIDDLVADAQAGFVDVIYITFPMRAEDRIRGVLSKLGDTTASVYIVPDFFVFQMLHSRWTDIGGLPAVSVFENPLYGVDGVAKRVFDFVVSSLLLLLLAVPMAIVALAVKLTSRGPVFFRQRRYGLDGNEILVWKFRSMRVCENGAKVTQATKNDSRLTPIGGLLRKTSIDELPQLFNVWCGSMSLVGPRPHAAAHNEQYRTMIDGYMLRHKVKPGITGLAQVRGFRGETDTLDKMQHRVEADHEYIREWSLWLDIKILLRTFTVVFSRQNAY